MSHIHNALNLYFSIPTFNDPEEIAWEKCINQYFLLSNKVFYPFFNFSDTLNFILSSANAFNLDKSKILLFGEELKLRLHHYVRLF